MHSMSNLDVSTTKKHRTGLGEKEKKIKKINKDLEQESDATVGTWSLKLDLKSNFF